MNVNIIKNEYKKTAYLKKLELYVNNVINGNLFESSLLNDYVIVLRSVYYEGEGMKRIKKYDYQFIDDVDAVQGYFIECLKQCQDINVSNYDNFGYVDVFDYFKGILFDNVNSNVFLDYRVRAYNYLK